MCRNERAFWPPSREKFAALAWVRARFTLSYNSWDLSLRMAFTSA